MKKLLTVIISAFSVAVAANAYADEGIKLNIDNIPVETDVSPQIIDGRTMVPVRAIFEGVGAQVNWEESTKRVTGNMAGIEVVMSIDSDVAVVNGNNVQMDCSPLIIDGRTFAPARYVAEAFGCSVEWDSENKTVNIKTPLFEQTTVQDTTLSETTTETTTQETTETTTDPMLNYDEYYDNGTYTIGVDMPEGEYVVFADADKIGYVYNYAKDGNVSTTTGKRYIYNKHFDYCDVIRVSKNTYVDISNAYAVPSGLVDKLDTSRNGTFRAGKDIETGPLTFKLSPHTKVAYVNVGVPDAANKDRTITYLTPENDRVVVNVAKGMYVKIFGCDVLDANLKEICTYKPKVIDESASDSTYNFEEITPSLKNEIDAYLTALVSEMEPKSMKSTKYTSNYAKDITSGWSSKAKTSADKKYVSLASSMYTHIRNYAYNTKGDIAYSARISMYSHEVSGAQYREILQYEKEYIAGLVNRFKEASSFGKVEEAVENMSYYRYDVPRLTGSTIQ